MLVKKLKWMMETAKELHMEAELVMNENTYRYLQEEARQLETTELVGTFADPYVCGVKVRISGELATGIIEQRFLTRNDFAWAMNDSLMDEIRRDEECEHCGYRREAMIAAAKRKHDRHHRRH